MKSAKQPDDKIDRYTKPIKPPKASKAQNHQILKKNILTPKPPNPQFFHPLFLLSPNKKLVLKPRKPPIIF